MSEPDDMTDPRCTCLPYPYGDGLERDCPVHGDLADDDEDQP